jgi:hypothetical protein
VDHQSDRLTDRRVGRGGWEDQPPRRVRRWCSGGGRWRLGKPRWWLGRRGCR